MNLQRGTSLQNVHINTDPQFSMPTKMREIPETWWNELLNGTLWALQLSSIPFPVKDFTIFRAAVYRQATKRSVNVSVRVEGLGTYLYIQAYPKSASGYDVRQPLSQAQAAPLMPRVLRTPVASLGAPKPPTYEATIDRLMEAHEKGGWENYPPSALFRHPYLAWMMRECTCPTTNYRGHLNTCGAYRYMGQLEEMLEMDVLQDQPPEEWVKDQERFEGKVYWLKYGRREPTPSNLL